MKSAISLKMGSKVSQTLRGQASRKHLIHNRIQTSLLIEYGVPGFSVHFDACADSVYQALFSGLGTRLVNYIAKARQTKFTVYRHEVFDFACGREVIIQNSNQ